MSDNKEDPNSANEAEKTPIAFKDIAFQKSVDGTYRVNVVKEEDFEYEIEDFDDHNADGLAEYRQAVDAINNEEYSFQAAYKGPTYDAEDDYYNPYSSGRYGYGFLNPDVLTVHYPDHFEENNIDAWQTLNNLIGLKDLKKQVKQIEHRANFDRKRYEKGLMNHKPGNHFTFTGNPGTGKNEVARILGALFKQTGVLSKGHVVEVDRSDLIMGWVGQSAIKTRELIEFAKGGILFIDEAYSLSDGAAYDFGPEVISTLIKGMEDFRDDLIVILAGYEEDMQHLINSNQGFKSRVRHKLHFPDYSVGEIENIYLKFCHDNDYVVHDDAALSLKKLVGLTKLVNPKTHGNGRFARNAFDITIDRMANRVMELGLVDDNALKTILFSDIPKIEDVIQEKSVLKTISEKLQNHRGDNDNLKD